MAGSYRLALLNQGRIHICPAKNRGAFAQIFYAKIPEFGKKWLQGTKTDWIGHPWRCRFIRVVFHNQKTAAGFQTGRQIVQQGFFILNIMQGVGHQDTILKKTIVPSFLRVLLLCSNHLAYVLYSPSFHTLLRDFDRK